MWNFSCQAKLKAVWGGRREGEVCQPIPGPEPWCGEGMLHYPRCWRELKKKSFQVPKSIYRELRLPGWAYHEFSWSVSRDWRRARPSIFPNFWNIFTSRKEKGSFLKDVFGRTGKPPINGRHSSKFSDTRKDFPPHSRKARWENELRKTESQAQIEKQGWEKWIGKTGSAGS